MYCFFVAFFLEYFVGHLELEEEKQKNLIRNLDKIHIHLSAV